jgi:DNA-binding CsgD family transcriptional regulator/PAS domain-containing protein
MLLTTYALNQPRGKIVEPNDAELTNALLDPLYNAATEPKQWPEFLKIASEKLRADKAVILLHAPKNERTSVCAEMGLEAESCRALERLNKISPWMGEIQKHQAEGWYSGSPEDVLPLEQFRKSKFYHELFLKHGIEWAAASVVHCSDGWMPNFTVFRSASGEPFNASEKNLLRQLAPHLRRVFSIYRALGALREQNAAGQYALDLSGAACITLDPLGRVLQFNRRAAALIGDESFVRIKEGRLLALVSGEQRALDTCLLKACACGAGKSEDPGEGALVLHSTQGTELYVSVLPYHSNWSILAGRPSAMLFMTTPEEQGRGEHRLWQTMFGLSPAECRVAEMMKQGMEVTEISEMIRIKVDTVRYYQKCIYRKTNVRGQGQMIRLLTRLPSSTP